MMERGERNDIDSMTGGGWYDNSTTVPGDDETWWWNAGVQKVIKAKKKANNMRNITNTSRQTDSSNSQGAVNERVV